MIALVAAALVVGAGWSGDRAVRARNGGAAVARAAVLHRGRADSAATASAPPWFAAAVEDAGIATDHAAVLWRGWVLGGVGLVFGAAAMSGSLAAGVVLVAAVGGPAGLLRARRGRAAERYGAVLPALLDDVAGAVRAGSSLVGALQEAADRTGGAVGADVAEACAAVARGAGLLEELRRWNERRPSEAVGLATAALAVGVTTGGRQARPLEGVAATLRERAAVAQEGTALATQAKASATVMVGTPIAFAAVAAVVDPRVGHLLLGTPLGLGCLALGLALDGAAALWMAQILRLAR